MTETYLLNMMQRIGGDSGSVGTALFIANVAEFAIIFCFERFRGSLSGLSWMKITAVCFAGKAFLFHIAPNVPFMYVAQALQAVTYGFFVPSMVHFANEEIGMEDSVKGQSMLIAVFTLGGSVGNLLGGILLERYSASVMTLSGFLFAGIGALICLSVRERGRRAFG